MLARPPVAWKRRADPAADEEARRVADRPQELQAPAQLLMPAARRPTAVLYVHFGQDADEEANLELFVRAGVQEDDNVQYRIILATPGEHDTAALPPLPGNARYLQPPRPACNSSTWGVLGEVLGQLDLQPFAYVVVASSKALGPVVPPYVRQVRGPGERCWAVVCLRVAHLCREAGKQQGLHDSGAAPTSCLVQLLRPGCLPDCDAMPMWLAEPSKTLTHNSPLLLLAVQHMHWTEVFTQRLNEATKLVGSQISCEGVPRGGDAGGEWRRNPYVLPYAWATDEAGWELLSAHKTVLYCHADPWDTKFHSDSAASLAILAKGWNLDSLMARYQGVDWRQRAAWGCNAGLRPDRLLLSDGAHHAPYELVFSPIAEAQAERHSALRAGLKYRDWSTVRDGRLCGCGGSSSASAGAVPVGAAGRFCCLCGRAVGRPRLCLCHPAPPSTAPDSA